MNSLKKLSAAVVLTFVLGVSVFAGQISTPPCAPPEPGQISTPPCADAQPAPDDPATPGQISTPPASNTVDMYLVTEAAMNVLQSMLTVF